MLDKSRHKRVRQEGYQARIDGRYINENRYSYLGKPGQLYASLWDAGWLDADKNIKQSK